ncbi:uncharacterized protein PRCAT00005521001 [Priceomyces carsonii]|uniref:uncharacterized protein n=1 Tax=Priceomyces carsonii TaxID=28549 RepID=UPI002ED8BB42|nr:unnamed protein product [Priceomyces carsonii]
MEKFSNWRDKGTGISPFMPFTEPSKGLTQKIGFIFNVIEVLFKAPIFIFLFILYQIVPYKVVGNLILLLCGFKGYDLLVEGIRKTKTDQIDLKRPRANDLVVVNYISPIDALIVSLCSNASYKNTRFIIPDKDGQLYSYSLWSFFNNCFNGNIGVPTSQEKISDLSDLRGELVFLFMEGTTSNNKGLLPFPPLKADIPDFFKIKVLALKLQPVLLTLPLPVISKSCYIFRLLTNSSNKSSIKTKIYELNEFDIEQIKKSFELSLLYLIGNDLNIEEKAKFYNYYLDHHIKTR